MKYLLNRIPPFFRNFYFLSSLFFLFWLLFIDGNDLFLQSKLTYKHRELIQAKQFYEDKILELTNDKAALESNPELLERLAREKYFMKKENEDLFIVVKSD